MTDLVDVRQRYRTLAKLGSGGMADVFLAVQLGVEDFERLVVLKRIQRHWLGQRDSFKMFTEEARLVASLNHPHIVKIHDLTWMGSDVFIAMEYIDGESLAFIIRELRERGERMPLPVALKVVSEACEALSYVHAATSREGLPLNLVHRDICPQNILLDSSGYVKIIDFGLARPLDGNTDVTSPGVFRGKLPYLAPEMLEHVEVDGRADLYALGLVLFELLTLRRAVHFDQKMVAVTEVVRRVSGESLPRVSDLVEGLDPRLDGVLAKATAKESVRRFQTGAGFAAELRRVGESLGGVASTAEVERWFRSVFKARIAQRREFERLAVRKASELPDLDERDSSPALRADRTASIGAVDSGGPGITKSARWSFDASVPAPFNPYLFVLVVFALTTGGGILFHQLFFDDEKPAAKSTVFVVSDNLFVRSSPPGADVQIDGKLVGNTGSAGLNWRVEPSREHLLELHLEGYEVYSLAFAGESFGQRRIDATLVPLAPHESAIATVLKRPARKRRGRHGRAKQKKRLAPAPFSNAADSEAVEASDVEPIEDDTDPLAPGLGGLEADVSALVATEDEQEAETKLAVLGNPIRVHHEVSSAAAEPPAQTMAQSPHESVALPTGAPHESVPPRAPVDEPVVQSTAEVMQRRTSGDPPEYPRRALVEGLETTVEVRVVISSEGRVSEIEYIAGERMFRPSVDRALRTWRFRALVIDGRAVETTAILKFVYRLESP